MAPNEDPNWKPGTPMPASPLKEGAKTWTRNGALCGPEFPGLTSAERIAGQVFVTLLPTMFIIAHPDFVRVVSLKLLGPERTELRAEWLFRRSNTERAGFRSRQCRELRDNCHAAGQ